MSKSKERASMIIAEHGDGSMAFMLEQLSQAVRNDEPGDNVAGLIKDLSNVRKSLRAKSAVSAS